MEKQTLKLALIQNKVSSTKEETIKSTEAMLRSAAKSGAQIVCLKEIFAGPYFCTVQEQSRFDLAESLDGPTVTYMAKLAKELKIVLIVPFFEKRAAGVYHNSAAVIEADGSLLGVYRKMHIPDDPLFFEKYYFAPGDPENPEGGFKVFDTSVAKVGVLICWDQWYPEAARITAMLGAEVIFYPTAIGWHPAEKAEFGEIQATAWQTIQRSHAIANGVFIASVNRVGHEATAGTDGIEFFGRSVVYAPFGQILAEAKTDQPEVIMAECDRSLIEYTRRNWPFFRDRRIDAYQPILNRFIQK